MTTLHANSPRDALSRLETMVLMASLGLPLEAIREQIASAVHVVIQQSRLSCGKRLITDVVEVTGMDTGTIQMQSLMHFDLQSREFVFSGIAPSFLESEVSADLSCDLQQWMRHP